MAVFIKEDTAEKLGKKVILPSKLTNLMTNKSNYYAKIAPKLQGYKRAKKIASAAEKEQYNTNNEKFNDNGSGVTLNYNEVKRWANALKHLPKNSDAFDANGGEEGKEMVDDLVKQVRRNSQKVDMVPEVDKLVDDLKISDKPLKPTKIGKADVYIESRKIYINENQLHKLRENYKELTIPFDNKYHMVNGQNIPMKYDYQYYLDWLEEIGRYGTLKGNPQNTVHKFFHDTWENNKTSLVSDILDNLENDGTIDELIYEISKILQNDQYYYGDEYFKIPIEEVGNAIDEIIYDESIDEFYDLLTDKGLERCQKLIVREIFNRLDNEGFLYHVNEENGLVYIERVIKLPSIDEYTEDNDKMQMGYSISNKGEDFYQYLVNNYSSVGEFWTWEKIGGNSYCANSGGVNINLKGYVRVEDINWDETLFVNGWSLNYEHEIRVNSEAPVEIIEIEVNDGKFNGKKFPLPKPIIVPA